MSPNTVAGKESNKKVGREKYVANSFTGTSQKFNIMCAKLSQIIARNNFLSLTKRRKVLLSFGDGRERNPRSSLYTPRISEIRKRAI